MIPQKPKAALPKIRGVNIPRLELQAIGNFFRRCPIGSFNENPIACACKITMGVDLPRLELQAVGNFFRRWPFGSFKENPIACTSKITMGVDLPRFGL